MAVVGLHAGDPWETIRTNFYPFYGYPTFMIDGLNDSWHGSPQWDYWDDDVNLRLAEPTDVTIDLTAVPGSAPEQWDLTATVCIEAGGTGKTMRLYLVEILDGYPPADPNFTRNGHRQTAPTEDATLAVGACTDVTWPMTLDATSMANLEAVSFICWAQDNLDSGLAEVFQATQLSWPLNSDTIFLDGFESSDTSGWDTTSP